MPTARNGDVEIAWDEQGSGDPVLLVMGHSFPATMWGRVAPVLAERYRVLTFDNRGAGKTGTPAAQWSMEDMADDAVAVLDAAGVDRAHVYGVSMGGGIAQVLAIRHPQRVGALVLGCTGVKKAPPATPKLRLALAVLPKLFSSRDEKAVAAAKVTLYGRGTPERLIREDLAMLKAGGVSPEGGKMQGAALDASPGTLADLPTVTAPTLVLHGTADVVVPIARGEQLAAAIPGARLVRLPGAGHNYTTDQTEAANSAVLEFLAEHTLADLAR